MYSYLFKRLTGRKYLPVSGSEGNSSVGIVVLLHLSGTVLKQALPEKASGLIFQIYSI